MSNIPQTKNPSIQVLYSWRRTISFTVTHAVPRVDVFVGEASLALPFFPARPFPPWSSHARLETSSKRRHRRRGVHGSPPLATDDLLVVAFELLRRDKCTLAVGHEAFSDSRTKRLLVVSSCIVHSYALLCWSIVDRPPTPSNCSTTDHAGPGDERTRKSPSLSRDHRLLGDWCERECGWPAWAGPRSISRRVKVLRRRRCIVSIGGLQGYDPRGLKCINFWGIEDGRTSRSNLAGVYIEELCEFAFLWRWKCVGSGTSRRWKDRWNREVAAGGALRVSVPGGWKCVGFGRGRGLKRVISTLGSFLIVEGESSPSSFRRNANLTD